MISISINFIAVRTHYSPPKDDVDEEVDNIDQEVPAAYNNTMKALLEIPCGSNVVAHTGIMNMK